ncbi:hypothetical protein [Fibrella aquatilis]|uniref:Uncharacterized protein n=1 Tax=Fibrella aquatilis TaxID=2817059 RepID=A0A939JZC1_9BACT|nr:hypothetical protein [Fibrella aquatilis]MBO0930025.1 hypothetical protein [Fibrella aquatilis]
MKLGTLLRTGLLLLSLSACRTTNLLVATFEGDAIGTAPTKDLPGAPVGDSVAYKAIISPWLRVQTSTFTPGQKALVFTNMNSRGEVRVFDSWLNFKGIRSTYDQTTWFYWTAKLGPVVGEMTIDVQGIQSLWVTRFRIMTDGRLMLVRDVGNENTSQLIGTLNNQTAHTIIISLSPQARTFDLSVFGARERRIINLTNMPVLFGSNPQADYEFERPSIHFSYSGQFIYQSSYVFEDVFISKRRPNP